MLKLVNPPEVPNLADLFLFSFFATVVANSKNHRQLQGISPQQSESELEILDPVKKYSYLVGFSLLFSLWSHYLY